MSATRRAAASSRYRWRYYFIRWYLSQLANDKKSPTLDLLLRVCAALGVKAATLVGRVERARPKKT